MIDPELQKKILNRLQKRPGRYSYPYEAYQFIILGLEFLLLKSGYSQHTKAKTICLNLVDFAHHQFGPLAWHVLQKWGLRTTNDLGNVVYELIDMKILAKSESDSPQDFTGLFSIEEQLQKRVYNPVENKSIKSIRGA